MPVQIQNILIKDKITIPDFTFLQCPAEFKHRLTTGYLTAIPKEGVPDDIADKINSLSAVVLQFDCPKTAVIRNRYCLFFPAAKDYLISTGQCHSSAIRGCKVLPHLYDSVITI